MTNVLVVNAALFLPVVLGGIAASWFGWVLAGRSGDDNADGGLPTELSPVHPHEPWPVEPRGSARLDDLARSA